LFRVGIYDRRNWSYFTPIETYPSPTTFPFSLHPSPTHFLSSFSKHVFFTPPHTQPFSKFIIENIRKKTQRRRRVYRGSAPIPLWISKIYSSMGLQAPPGAETPLKRKKDKLPLGQITLYAPEKCLLKANC